MASATFRERKYEVKSVRNGTGPTWRKSSYSSDTANCVEVALLATGVGVRDSKNQQGPVLSYAVPSWQEFVTAVRDGEFEPPTSRR
jgi:hypothetical protein